jgi:hypothetical protein
MGVILASTLLIKVKTLAEELNFILEQIPPSLPGFSSQPMLRG